jgi:hypothetical protein
MNRADKLLDGIRNMPNNKFVQFGPKDEKR